MTDIPASAVKSLRDRTGAGMMDCKRALEETGGDEEEAIDLLRQRGAAQAAKRADRETSEGTVQISEGDGALAMVEASCETDFVAKNDDFREFARRAAEVARSAEVPEGEVRPGSDLVDRPAEDPLREELNELRAAIGESLALERFVRLVPGSDSAVGSYLHYGDKIGVVVELEDASGAEAPGALARDVAMHVAASDPVGIDEEDVPEEERERERRVLEEQAKQQDKPPEIVEKIVEGRMRKFFEQNTLLRQPFVKDPDRSVSEVIEERAPGASVRRFVRFEVGG